MNGLFQTHKFKKMNQVQFIAVGFLAIILIGSLLLMLPFATKSGQNTDYLGALFTSTSATCVTGLLAYDTFTHWTIFGQIIILMLIQIGGLGFITIGIGFAVLFRRRIGLRQRDLMKESVSAMEIGSIIKLWKKIIIGSFIFEGLGAVLLSIRFVQDFGFSKGVYYGIFHSISAFCNSGFDLMGTKEAFSSFTSYVSDPLVNIVLCLLMLVGSLGFFVWSEIAEYKFEWKKYSLHSKIVLTMLLILVIGGTVLLYLFEKDNTLSNFNGWSAFWPSLFGAVTSRAAGFNTIDTGAMTSGGKLLTTILMFIGGNSGSTAGGIKTTTLAVLIVYAYSYLKGKPCCSIFKRRISDEVIKKATIVVILNLTLALTASLIIMGTNNLGAEDILFETFAATSTVGMSTGLTRELNLIGRIIYIILMYAGRIGSITFALSLLTQSKQKLKYPIERVNIG